MRELREDTFLGNKNDDAYEHVERILNIVSLFNILGVTHYAVMLRVFPITLIGATKRWVDRLFPGMINTWDLPKNTFIQWYCPPSKIAKKLEEIHNFKHEGDETLYQAWERSTSRRVSNDSSNGIVAIINKLDILVRDMKKLKENVHAIQVGCENCGGAHLNKECSLNEEVKSFEEVPKEMEEGQQGVLPCQLPPKELNTISFTLPYTIGNDLFSYESPLCLEFEKHNYLRLTKQNNVDTFVSDDMQEDCEGEKGMTIMVESETKTPRLHYYKRLQVLKDEEFEFWPTCDPSLKVCNGGDRIHGLDEQGNIKL
nr:hypothetical protein [Tanacetum cinerariifolium]